MAMLNLYERNERNEKKNEREHSKSYSWESFILNLQWMIPSKRALSVIIRSFWWKAVLASNSINVPYLLQKRHVMRLLIKKLEKWRNKKTWNNKVLWQSKNNERLRAVSRLLLTIPSRKLIVNEDCFRFNSRQAGCKLKIERHAWKRCSAEKAGPSWHSNYNCTPWTGRTNKHGRTYGRTLDQRIRFQRALLSTSKSFSQCNRSLLISASTQLWANLERR